MKRSLDSKPRVIVPNNTEDNKQSAGSFNFTWMKNKQMFTSVHGIIKIQRFLENLWRIHEDSSKVLKGFNAPLCRAMK